MPFPKTRAELIAANYVQTSSHSTCRACHAPIEFWTTPANSAIPMNPMPHEDSAAISHFATCPNAAQFRKGKK